MLVFVLGIGNGVCSGTGINICIGKYTLVFVFGESEAKQKRKATEQGGRGKSKGKMEGDTGKDIIDLLTTKALKTKSRYLNVTGQATAFRHQVCTDPAYSWVNETIMAPVLQCHEALQDKLTSFTLNIVSGGLQELKKKYTLAELEENLREVVAIDPLIKNLAREVEIIMKMNAARLPTGSSDRA